MRAISCFRLPAWPALLLLGLACSCASDDDDADLVREQALVSTADWAMAADPAVNLQPRGRGDLFLLDEVFTQQEIHPGWPHDEPIRVLRWVHRPFSFLAGSTVHINPESWTSLATRPALDTLSTVLEWKMRYDVLPEAGSLVIDIGEFSEDALANGRLDSEDMNDNATLEGEEDLGLDRMDATDAPWPLPVEMIAWSGDDTAMQAQFGAVYDWLELDWDRVRSANEPWSWDDWSAGSDADPFAGHPSGLEGNGVLDSEDLDGDLTLDTADNFHRYVLPLDPANPTRDAAITQLNGSDWLQASLQLEREHTTVGTPDLSRPVRVRMTVVGIEGDAVLELTWFDWR